MSKITSERLGYQRELNHLSRKMVAERIDKSVNTVSDYENNVSDPPHSILVKLANMFNCSTDYLLGNDDINPSSNTIDITELSETEKASVRQLVESMISTNHSIIFRGKSKD